MEPQNRIGLGRLTKMAFDGVDLNSYRTQLLNQSVRCENPAGAFMDLSVIDQIFGNLQLGLEWQAKALDLHRGYSTNRRGGDQKKLLVLAEAGPMGANTPVEFLLKDYDFEIITYYPQLGSADMETLPEHDVMFCASPVDSPKAQDFHDHVAHLTRTSPLRALNLPQSPVRFERDALASFFPKIAGLRFPETICVPGQAPAQTIEELIRDRIGDYPVVIRPEGSHAGVGLAKLATQSELIDYLETHDAQAFYVSEFVDYASPQDGSFRKYRIVFVDGVAFPCHMAVSDQWDVWYMNSKMGESDEKRHEEATFMDRFEADFAVRHGSSFAALTGAVDLEYFGIDCAEDAAGNLIVFEADNALIVHDMDPEDIFPYKGRHMRRIFKAFEAMLRDACLDDQVREAVPTETGQANSRTQAHVLA